MSDPRNYQRRGLARPPREKKGLFKFFEIYGRHMWKLMQVNIIYVVIFIPFVASWWLSAKFNSYAPFALSLITAVCFGPATAGMTKVCRNYSQERHAFAFADFFESFKKNFKQSLIMGIIDTIFIVGFTVAIPTYLKWAEKDSFMYVPFVMTLSFLIVFFMMHFYIYLMISSTTLSLFKILRNSFFLVPLGLKASISTFATWIFVVLMILFLYPYTLFIIPFWPLSFLCFVSAYNCYPVIRKFVIQPYYDAKGEDNPEFDYLKKKDNETVFEDNPELDKPVDKKEIKKKGKTIS